METEVNWENPSCFMTQIMRLTERAITNGCFSNKNPLAKLKEGASR